MASPRSAHKVSSTAHKVSSTHEVSSTAHKDVDGPRGDDHSDYYLDGWEYSAPSFITGSRNLWRQLLQGKSPEEALAMRKNLCEEESVKWQHQKQRAIEHQEQMVSAEGKERESEHVALWREREKLWRERATR